MVYEHKIQGVFSISTANCLRWLPTVLTVSSPEEG